jgi:hypothetical protein
MHASFDSPRFEHITTPKDMDRDGFLSLWLAVTSPYWAKFFDGAHMRELNRKRRRIRRSNDKGVDRAGG